jgi:hypothetical protein
MPITISEILESQNLTLGGKVKWKQRFKFPHCGIYIVSYSKDENDIGELIKTSPISTEKIKYWLNKVQTFELEKKKNPKIEDVIERLSKFWIPDESILYIGMTSATVSIRVSQYYSTELGERRPHAGGHWLKTLSNLPDLYVYYSECNNFQNIEANLLDYFGNNISEHSKKLLYDSNLILPFANLEHPFRGRKKHGIGRAKLKN